MAKLKQDDEVIVIAGKDKGKRGTVRRVIDSDRVVVSGVNMIKKHTKKTQEHPQGAIVEREGSIHISNVMKAEKDDARNKQRAGSEPAEEADD